MRRTLSFLIFLLTVVVCDRLTGQVATSKVIVTSAVPNEMIVRLRTADQLAAARVAASMGESTITPLSPSLGLYVVKSNTTIVEPMMTALAQDNNILYVEPNYVFTALDVVPDDPSFTKLTGLQNIAAPKAWSRVTGSNGAAIAIIDTGIDYRHPDLAGNVWSAPAAFSVQINGQTITCPAGSHGFNTIAMTCDPLDDATHGTHVAGTVGAVGNNGIGVTGVNWTAQIVAIKFLNSRGVGTLSDAINAIEFAMQAKAAFAGSSTPLKLRVLSTSWGSGIFSQSLLDEINQANASDLLLVSAAGNAAANNDSAPVYPASYNAPNVVSVAATDSIDALAGFSDYGLASVHLAAPGVDILSTVPGGGYAVMSGTSMATPHVSGAALLILGACPWLSTAQLKATILTTVDPTFALTQQTISGGRLNVAKAIESCAAPAQPPPGCVQTVAADHWRGEYFDNFTASGTPLMIRDDGDASLDLVWNGSVSTTCNVPATAFSARWTRTATFNDGNYLFLSASSDGLRVYVDDKMVVDRWFDQGAVRNLVPVGITSGTHTIIVEYYKNTGHAAILLSWPWMRSGPFCAADTVIPTDWKAEYFPNMSLSGTPTMVRDEGSQFLNASWPSATSPNSQCNVPAAKFSVRWTRSVTFTQGSYLFTTSSSDGIRVSVDDRRIVDNWVDQPASASTTAPIDIAAGAHTITVEYYKNAVGPATASVTWQMIPPLTLTSVTPTSGVAGTTPQLTLRGTGFDSSFRAFLVADGQAAEITNKALVNDTTVQVTPLLTGSGDPNAAIRIMAGTQTASIAFPIETPLTITSITPVTAVAGTSPLLTITGTGFAPNFRAYLISGAATTEISSKAFVNSANIQITPSLTGSGNPAAKIQITSGTQTAAIPFPIQPPLTITSVVPATAVGGTAPTLTLTGTGVDGTFRAYLIAGGQTTEIVNKTFASDTSLQVTPNLPAAGDPNAKIQITVGSQTASIAFLIVTPLTISAASPATAVGGATPVITLTGTGFDATFRAFVLSGNQTTEITSKMFISNTSVQLTPALPTSGDPSAKLQITVGTQTASIMFPILTPLSIRSAAPNTAIAGTTPVVTLTGTGFDSSFRAFLVTAGQALEITNKTFSSDTGVQVTPTLPEAGDSSAMLRIVAGTQTASIAFPIQTRLTIASATPPNAIGGTSTSVTLNGTGFDSSFRAFLISRGQTVEITAKIYVNPNSVQITLALPASGDADAKLQISGGTQTAAVPFPIQTPLTLTSVAPRSAVAGTSPAITLTGTGMDNSFRAFLIAGGVPVEITSKLYVNDTTVQLTPVLPAAADPVAKIQITVGAQTAFVAFPIQTRLVIASATPNVAIAGMPISMTLTGTGFDPTFRAFMVMAGKSTEITNKLFITANGVQLQFSPAVGVTGDPNAKVIITVGDQTASINIPIKPVPLAIDSITPTPVAAGTSPVLTITGMGFDPSFRAFVFTDWQIKEIAVKTFISASKIQVTPLLNGSPDPTAMLLITVGDQTASISLPIQAPTATVQAK